MHYPTIFQPIECPQYERSAHSHLVDLSNDTEVESSSLKRNGKTINEESGVVVVNRKLALPDKRTWVWSPEPCKQNKMATITKTGFDGTVLITSTNSSPVRDPASALQQFPRRVRRFHHGIKCQWDICSCSVIITWLLTCGLNIRCYISYGNGHKVGHDVLNSSRTRLLGQEFKSVFFFSPSHGSGIPFYSCFSEVSEAREMSCLSQCHATSSGAGVQLYLAQK